MPDPIYFTLKREYDTKDRFKRAVRKDPRLVRIEDPNMRKPYYGTLHDVFRMRQTNSIVVRQFGGGSGWSATVSLEDGKVVVR